MLVEPRFPPLFKGHATGRDAFAEARRRAVAGELGAGDLVWRRTGRSLDLALVLEPTVSRVRCHEMLFCAMAAFGDALGALGPAETAITYRWPSAILVNGAVAGEARLVVSPGHDKTDCPDWLVVGLSVALRPSHGDPDPGFHADRTVLSEEGCGELEPVALLESTSRHLLNWIHTWHEEGFRPVHAVWTGRMEPEDECCLAYEDGMASGTPAGLDENGSLLLRQGSRTRLLLVERALAAAQKAP